MNKLILGIVAVAGFSFFNASAQKPPEKPPTVSRAAEENKNDSAEIDAQSSQRDEKIQRIQQALEAGIAAHSARNYALAIEKFDEGYRLDPDFTGSAPIFLNNKAMALRMLGAAKYQAAVKENRIPSLEANQYFVDSVATYKIARRLLDEAETPTDESMKKAFAQNRFNTLRGLTESYRLLVLTDKTKIGEAIEFFENYIESETDESERKRAADHLKELKAKYKID